MNNPECVDMGLAARSAVAVAAAAVECVGGQGRQLVCCSHRHTLCVCLTVHHYCCGVCVRGEGRGRKGSRSYCCTRSEQRWSPRCHKQQAVAQVLLKGLHTYMLGVYIYRGHQLRQQHKRCLGCCEHTHAGQQCSSSCPAAQSPSNSLTTNL